MADIKLLRPEVTITTSIGELNQALHRCELAGRLCYDSTDKLDPCLVNKEFLGRLINKHHESVLEHASFSAVFLTDRAVTHQLVRHRLSSFSQQSQRYCRYSCGEGKHKMAFIEPFWGGTKELGLLTEGLKAAADTYEKLLQAGMKPEEARAVLPNCTATKIYVTANVRQWRHILKERLAPGAQFDIMMLMYSVYRSLEDAGFGYLVSDIPVCDKAHIAWPSYRDWTTTHPMSEHPVQETYPIQ